MDLFAPIVRNLVAPAWAWWESSPYLRHYRQLLRTEREPAELVRQRQWAKVLRQIQHAYDTTDFYRDRLDEADLSPEHVRTPQDLLRLPFLTKDDVRQSGDRLRSKALRHQPLTRHSTSGSTGISVEVLMEDEALQFKRAATLRSDEWSGWRRGERSASIWGNPDYLKHGWRGRVRNALLERIHYLDTLKMDVAAMRRFAHHLIRRKPALIFGHAHSLYLFAEFCRKEGHSVRPKAIISSAMVLHDWERQSIENAFATRVTNRYGSEEVGLIACECEAHNGLHINADGVYVEIIRTDGTHAEPGEPGAVVITDLINRATPLIRYQIGDMAVLSGRTCCCGRGLPLLERIEGRVADYVVTPSGELVSGISLTQNLHTQVPGVVQMQIIQERVDWLHFRLVRDESYSHASERALKELVALRFGEEVAYDCEFVDRILPEASGKHRFCISKVPNPFSQPQSAAL